MLFAISSAIAVNTVVVTALPNCLYAWLSETTCFQSLYVLYNNYIYNVYKDGKYRLEGET